MWPGSDAVWISQPAASRAGFSTTWIPTPLRLRIATGELARAVHGRLDRVQEGGADAGLLELADRRDRRPARRSDHLAQLDGVHLQVAQLLRRPEHRLHDELRRDLAR